MKARKKGLLNYLSTFNGEWRLTSDVDCDVCAPLDVVEMNWFISERRKGRQDIARPWFCEAHAREFNLLW
jgi:hypothetical protein